MWKNKYEKVLETIEEEVLPDEEEWRNALKKADNVKKNIYELVRKIYDISLEDVVILGSVPRYTFLKSDYDIDIFLRFSEYADLKKVVEYLYEKIPERFGYRVKLRYADHPYLEILAESMTFNIVPSYKTKYPNWKTPMDRSYYHHRYLLEKNIQDKFRDVIFLKAFFKGIGVYGAEVYVGGFSGYLVELLILYYGSFLNALKNIAKWRPNIVIDIERYYSSRKEAVDAFNNHHLIVVDPVDRSRNVAAAVTIKAFSKVISASKAFLHHPSEEFFRPLKHKLLKSDEIEKVLSTINLAVILLKHQERIPDIHFSQLERISRKISNILRNHKYVVLKRSIYSDYKSKSVIVFMLENLNRPVLEISKGPYPYLESETQFITKNRGKILWIDRDGRWYVLRKSKYPNVIGLLMDIFKKNMIKIPDVFSDFVSIYTGKEVFDLLSDPDIREWIENFVFGDTFWIKYY